MIRKMQGRSEKPGPDKMNIKPAYFFSLALLAMLAGIPVLAQLSPGELSKVHAHLEGLSNCTKCHILGKKVSNQKCLDCHTELKSRIAANKGYHSSPEIKGKECVVCHSDHHGLNFQIIRFAAEKFNHDLTGFRLTGAHAKKECGDCHKTDFIKDAAVKKKNFTYLGLEPSCLACHADYHQQTLSTRCSDCHGADAFKPAVNFDHGRAKFQLVGRHRDVPCISCHRTIIKNEQKFQEFKGVRFGNCTDCHKDVHNNKFGQNCTQCHTEQSFSSIKGVKDFDHDKTDFRLEGKHRGVVCSACHKTKYTNALKYGRCSDCHADYHKSQFARNGLSPDCSQCHTVNGFSEFTFTLEQHNKSVFQLKGAHLATPCFACHKRNTVKTDTAWNFREIGKRCADCHENLHKNFISEKFFPEASCDSCHKEARWSEINFDHRKTSFELTGSHATKGCRDCHFRKDAGGTVLQKFSGLSANCADCHKDVHAKQFDRNGLTDCGRCHDPLAFRPAAKFDHNKTLFPLDGKHKDVACAKCHKATTENGVVFILYKIKEFKCENCHH